LDIHWSVTVVPQNIVVHSYPWVKQGSDIAVAKAVAAFALGCRSGFVDFAAVADFHRAGPALRLVLSDPLRAVGAFEEISMRYVLLWLIGIPIPVLLVLYLFFH